MSVLSDTEILDRLADGRLVMYPRRDPNIRGSSVDLTLGRYFWRCRSDVSLGIVNPFSVSDTAQYFAGPYLLKPYASVYRKVAPRDFYQDLLIVSGSNVEPRYIQPGPEGGWPPPDDAAFEGIPLDWPVLVLRPRERILAHTHEFFGTHPPGTCEMRARSTWGRWGIAVCLCAGWGDPGYINRWTMEVHNTNDAHVIIPYGERICQMVVHESGEAREHYGSEHVHYVSKYQHHDDLGAVVRNWDPRDMLPKAWRDQRVKPEPTRPEEDF